MRIHVTIKDAGLITMVNSIPKHFLGHVVQEALRHYMAQGEAEVVLDFLKRAHDPDGDIRSSPKKKNVTTAPRAEQKMELPLNTTTEVAGPAAKKDHSQDRQSKQVNQSAGIADILGDFTK